MFLLMDYRRFWGVNNIDMYKSIKGAQTNDSWGYNCMRKMYEKLIEQL